MLDPAFRRTILTSIRPEKAQTMKIPQYARYAVDTQILHRDKTHENDRKWGYGYSPIQCLCAVKTDGTVDKRFFEFNSVNHFLVVKDGDSAVEVVACILTEWTKEDKGIKDFDVDIIDAELVKVEHEYLEERKKAEEKDKAVNEAGSKIKDAVDPVLESVKGLGYDEAAKTVSEKASEILEKMKEEKVISSYALAFNRNTADSKARDELFVDIGYRLAETDGYTVLACHVRGSSEKKDKADS